MKIGLSFPFLLAMTFILGACTTTVTKKEISQNDAKLESPIVTAQHVFNASPERVWEILTTARYVQHWWGPLGFTGVVRKHEFKQNGRFMWGMEGPGFPMQWNVGQFTEILPQRRLVMKMSFADPSGKVVPAEKLGLPGRWPDSVDVILDLRDMNGQTHVKLTERGIPAEMAQPAAMGWVQQFDKMDKLLVAP